MLLLSGKHLNPIAGHLEKTSWSVFGTLTWDNDSATRFAPSTEAIHRKDFRWLVSKSASRLSLQTRNVAYYGKTEWGPAMRGHFNFLIARQGTEKVSPKVLAQPCMNFGRRGVAGRKLNRSTQHASKPVAGINQNWNLKPMASRFVRLKLFRAR
jgi:hypothetical protein